MRKSKCSYWTLLRPKYCAPPLPGSPMRSAPRNASSVTGRRAKRVIIQSRGRAAPEGRIRVAASAASPCCCWAKLVPRVKASTAGRFLPLPLPGPRLAVHELASSPLPVTSVGAHRYTSCCLTTEEDAIWRHHVHDSPCLALGRRSFTPASKELV